MIHESGCSLCQTEDGSISHLFFDCKVSKAILKDILSWLEVAHDPKVWLEESKWVMDYTKRKGWKARLMKLAVTKALYGIWLYRNDVSFDKNMHTTIFLIES